jgi:hypothetical protein
MKKLTKKEMEIIVSLLRDHSDYLSNRCCNDYDWPCNWTDEEKTKFTKDYHDWNGDPEEYIEGDILSSDFSVAAFLASKLKQLDK